MHIQYVLYRHGLSSFRMVGNLPWSSDQYFKLSLRIECSESTSSFLKVNPIVSFSSTPYLNNIFLFKFKCLFYETMLFVKYLINTFYFYMTLRSARFSSFLFVLRFSWYYFGIHPKKIIRNFRKASNMCIFNFSFKKFCVTKELQNDWNMKLLKKFMEPRIRKIMFFSWKMKIN